MRIFAMLLSGVMRIAATPSTGSNPLLPMAKAYSAVKSVHAQIKMPKGQNVTVDMVMPDKFRESLFNGIQVVIIGSDMWMSQAAGKWMKLPIAMPQMRTMIEMAKSNAASAPADYNVTYLGSEKIDGIATKHYRMVSKSDNKPVQMWVGANNLPVQIEVDSNEGPVYVVYSQYNAVPAINPPM